MPGLRREALREFEERRAEEQEAEHIRQEEACGLAVKTAWARFGHYPEAAVWSPELRLVILQFDGGATRLAWTQGANKQWHVVFECESCGGPVLGSREVRTLSEIGRELATGSQPEDFDRHICDMDRAQHRLATRKLSEYLGEALSEPEGQNG